MFSRIKSYVLNREAKIPKRKPEDVIRHLGIQPGMTVLDLGAGGGYFTLRFAALVGPAGKVIAVDTDRAALQNIGRLAREKGLRNIRTLPSDGEPPALPEHSVDVAFNRDTYHHLRDAATYFRSLRPALKPDGRVVIIDYCKTGLIQRLFPHHTEPATIRAELEQAGFQRIVERDFLQPGQSFQEFRKQE